MIETFTDMIRNEFEKRKELTIKQLYETFSKNKNVEFHGYQLHTRIRTIIWRLKENNEIGRIRHGTYRKI